MPPVAAAAVHDSGPEPVVVMEIGHIIEHSGPPYRSKTILCKRDTDIEGPRLAMSLSSL